MTPKDILARLIAHDTTSHRSNRPLIEEVAAWLRAAGVEVTLLPDASGEKVNLHARVGPTGPGGVLLSGHVDTVPVEGQPWTRPPFRLTEEGGRLYGRGTTDMKGFDACAIAAMLDAAMRPLRQPLNLALSHDEEVGCVGVRGLIDWLAGRPDRPGLCIVGEPTGMAVATGHKGKIGLRVTCRGREGHSALAPQAINALHLAGDLMGAIRAEQSRLAAEGACDADYAVPYTTLHVGRLSGGTALNIVPGRAELEFEIRNVAADDPGAILSSLKCAAARIAEAYGPGAAGFEWAETIRYPGLATAPDSPAVRLVQNLTGRNTTEKVAYGTEGGLFAERLGMDTVICGPGRMDQGHKPDEYIEEDQLQACAAMLEELLARLES